MSNTTFGNLLRNEYTQLRLGLHPCSTKPRDLELLASEAGYGKAWRAKSGRMCT
jgi:hypothetical protein